jgi:hypothetical protein
LELGRLHESSDPTISIREAGILSSHRAMLIDKLANSFVIFELEYTTNINLDYEV